MTETLPLLDQGTLQSLKCDVGEKTFGLLVASMRRELSNGDSDLRAACEASDWSALERQAHALKSASRTFGAERLGQACERLEAAARDQESPAGAKPAIKPLLDDALGLITDMAKRLDTL